MTVASATPPALRQPVERLGEKNGSGALMADGLASLL